VIAWSPESQRPYLIVVGAFGILLEQRSEEGLDWRIIVLRFCTRTCGASAKRQLDIAVDHVRSDPLDTVEVYAVVYFASSETKGIHTPPRNAVQLISYL